MGLMNGCSSEENKTSQNTSNKCQKYAENRDSYEEVESGVYRELNYNSMGTISCFDEELGKNYFDSRGEYSCFNRDTKYKGEDEYCKYLIKKNDTRICGYDWDKFPFCSEYVSAQVQQDPSKCIQRPNSYRFYYKDHPECKKLISNKDTRLCPSDLPYCFELTYKARLDAWIGKSISDVIGAAGMPQTKVENLPNGSKMYIWTYIAKQEEVETTDAKGNNKENANLSYNKNSADYTSSNSSDSSGTKKKFSNVEKCDTSFVVDQKGIVKSHGHTGNICMKRGLERDNEKGFN